MDHSFEKREYSFEKLGWFCMACLVVAACLGLLGKGPFLSSRELRTPALHMEYQRFLRYGDPTKLKVEVGPAERDGPLVVYLPNAYLEGFRIVQITPEPEAMTAGAETAFQFRQKKDQGPVTLVFHLEPERSGPVQGTIRIGSGNPEGFSQFVYP